MELRRVPGSGVDADQALAAPAMAGDGRVGDPKRRSPDLILNHGAEAGVSRAAAEAWERRSFM